MSVIEYIRLSAELTRRSPFSDIRVEFDERGWYHLYVWTGETVLWYLGPTLPLALHLMAQDLYGRYGKEI